MESPCSTRAILRLTSEKGSLGKARVGRNAKCIDELRRPMTAGLEKQINDEITTETRLET